MNTQITYKKRKLHDIEKDINQDLKYFFYKNESLFFTKIDNLASNTKKNFKNIKTKIKNIKSEINNMKDDIKNFNKELEKNNMLLEKLIIIFDNQKFNNKNEINNKIKETNKEETFNIQTLYIS